MGERLRIFLIVALAGFMAGVIAQLAADYFIPWLMSILPSLVQAKFLVSGLAGACLTLVMVGIWAHFSKSKDHY